MQKSTEFETSVLEVIQKRRSLRAYRSTPVEPEKIKALFEAARWAPSSVNEQPWLYIYASKGDALWNDIFDSLNDGNQTWVAHAPLLIASFVRTKFLRNDRPNNAARYDLGAANALLSLQATHEGLNVHQMGGFNAEVLRSKLNVPDYYEPVIVLAIGYPGEADMLPETLKAREIAPRERYVQTSFVMNRAFDPVS